MYKKLFEKPDIELPLTPIPEIYSLCLKAFGCYEEYQRERARVPRTSEFRLHKAFAWDNTVRGDFYWTGIYDNLRKFEALLILIKAVDQTALRYVMTEGYKLESFYPTLDLEKAFDWKETPQGWDYWQSIEHKMLKLGADKAIKIIEKAQGIWQELDPQAITDSSSLNPKRRLKCDHWM